VKVNVVVIDADGVSTREVTLAKGAKVSDALAALQLSWSADDGIALWGRRCRPETELTEGARVELARKLLCDPKRVRREHALEQGDIRVVTRGRHGGRRKVERPAG